jgi:hypothetical protein
MVWVRLDAQGTSHGDEVFVGIDTAKAHNAVAVAEAGRDGEMRYPGTCDNAPEAVARLVRELSIVTRSCISATKPDRWDTGCISRSCRTMVQKPPFLHHSSAIVYGTAS